MVDRGPVMLGNTTTFGAFMIGIVALRLWFRVTRKILTWSDFCIVFGAGTAIIQSILNILCVTNWGYGQHAVDIPLGIRKSTTPILYLWLNQVFFKLTSMMTKLSLFFVYRDLFRKADSRLVRYSRIVNYATAFFVATFYFAIFIVVTFQCTPVAKSWKTKLPGTCVDIRSIRYVTAVVNIVTSLLVIGLPLPLLFSMKQRGYQLTQIISLVMLGLIHTMCAIGRLIILIVPALATDKDSQFNVIPNNTAGMIEMDIGIIAASLVVMRPAFQFLHQKFTGRVANIKGLSASGEASRYVHMPSEERRKSKHIGSITKTEEIELESQSIFVWRDKMLPPIPTA